MSNQVFQQNLDDTMKIYQPEALNIQTLIQTGAYQSWIFGPSLLDENGKAKKDFFYHSETYQLMREGISDMHCMNDEYLVEELQEEYVIKY